MRYSSFCIIKYTKMNEKDEYIIFEAYISQFTHFLHWTSKSIGISGSLGISASMG